MANFQASVTKGKGGYDTNGAFIWRVDTCGLERTKTPGLCQSEGFSSNSNPGLLSPKNSWEDTPRETSLASLSIPTDVLRRRLPSSHVRTTPQQHHHHSRQRFSRLPQEWTPSDPDVDAWVSPCPLAISNFPEKGQMRESLRPALVPPTYRQLRSAKIARKQLTIVERTVMIPGRPGVPVPKKSDGEVPPETDSVPRFVKPLTAVSTRILDSCTRHLAVQKSQESSSMVRERLLNGR